MNTKVTFLDRDEILAALVRALVAKAAGHGVVKNMTDEYLQKNGFYRFELKKQQSDKLQRWVAEYLAERFRQLIEITEE